MSSLQTNVTQFLWGTRNDAPEIMCAKHSVASLPGDQCGKGGDRDPTAEMPEDSSVSIKL